ncbi:MAG: shikimate kinase [Lentisphaerae bacterium]|nr:shikimate kinase [Lentisphaerota bacterium]
MHNRNIVLAGFMGAGKTAVGRALAQRLSRTFLDMDAELEARAGKPISLIFAEDGEAAFRRMERELVVECSCRANLVIAAGGGVVLNPDNVRDFSATGYVICLKAAPEEILRRVAGSKERPLLEQGDKAERIRALLKSRQKLYDALPYQVDTTGKSVAQVVAEVLTRICCRGVVNPTGS